MPLAFFPPMLLTLVDEPPAGDAWQHEIKFDGYRLQIIIDGASVRLFTRNGFDWSPKFPTLANAAARLGVDSAILDGELILSGEDGKPDFHGLRTAIRKREADLAFMAFDLLHLNGHDLRGMVTEERRHILTDLIEPGHDPIRYSERVEGDGSAVFRAVERMGLEGMVSKRADSPYVSGRSDLWRKVKCYDEAEFGIIGVQRERGKPAMALMADTTGRYVGAAFVTLPRGIRDRLWQRVQAKAGAKPPKGLAAEKAEWVKPGLVARVKFLKGEDKLRHASVQDFREGVIERKGEE